MSRKILFFDIDGTLMEDGPSHFVPDSTFRARQGVGLSGKNNKIFIENRARTGQQEKAETAREPYTSFYICSACTRRDCCSDCPADF